LSAVDCAQCSLNIYTWVTRT